MTPADILREYVGDWADEYASQLRAEDYASKRALRARLVNLGALSMLGAAARTDLVGRLWQARPQSTDTGVSHG